MCLCVFTHRAATTSNPPAVNNSHGLSATRRVLLRHVHLKIVAGQAAPPPIPPPPDGDGWQKAQAIDSAPNPLERLQDVHKSDLHQ